MKARSSVRVPVGLFTASEERVAKGRDFPVGAAAGMGRAGRTETNLNKYSNEPAGRFHCRVVGKLNCFEG
jgi:hypothetical protein